MGNIFGNWLKCLRNGQWLKNINMFGIFDVRPKYVELIDLLGNVSNMWGNDLIV